MKDGAHFTWGRKVDFLVVPSWGEITNQRKENLSTAASSESPLSEENPPSFRFPFSTTAQGAEPTAQRSSTKSG